MRSKFKWIFTLVLALSMQFSFAQEKTVTGTVTDGKLPLPGANVVIKGTAKGVSADMDGKYSIKAKPGDVLVVSFTGYDSQSVSVGASSSYAIKLKETSTKLEDVLVLGYGQAKKKNEYTGNVTKIGGDIISKMPMASIDQALQGRVAGLSIAATSGTPGSVQNIRIRGANSLNSGVEPLYVIDGVPVVSGDVVGSTSVSTLSILATMSSDNIESITVLKDAVSTSAYGSRGTNGVILITTKKGKNGATKFSFNSTVGFQNRAIKGVRVLTGAEKGMLFEEGVKNTYGTQFLPNQSAYDFILASANGTGTAIAGANPAAVQSYIDWKNAGSKINDWNALVQNKNALMTSLDFGAQGGDAKQNFSASLGYNKTEGVVIGSSFKRITANLSYSNQLTDKAKFSNSLAFSNVEQLGILEKGGYFGNPNLTRFFLSPWISPYNNNGTLNTDMTGTSMFNTKYLADHNYHKTNLTRFLNSTNASYSFTKNFKFSSVLGIDFSVSNYHNFANSLHGDGASANGYVEAGSDITFNYVTQNFFDYYFKINDNNKFEAKVLMEYQKTKFSGVYAYGEDLTRPEFEYVNGTNANYAADSYFQNKANLAYMGMLNYKYKNKYVVDLTVRNESSSLFSEKSRKGTFYSAGAAWNMNKESFLQNVESINSLKLRASYGTTGNSSVAINSYQSALGSTPYNSVGGLYPTSYGGTPTWEVAYKTDLGVDFELFNNRYRGSVAFFNSKATKMLQPSYPLSPTQGFDSYIANAGDMVNKGYEIALDVDVIRSKMFNWTVGGNYTGLKNEIVSLTKPDGTSYNYTIGLTKNEEGHVMNEWFMKKWAGVDSATGSPLWYVNGVDGATTSTYNNAVAAYQGKNALPSYYGGINNHFELQNFFMDVNLYFSGGNKVYQNWASYTTASGFNSILNYNGTEVLLDRWQKPGDVTDVPKMEATATGSSAASSSTRFLYDGDFVRLRQMSIGYSFKSNVLTKLNLTGLSFSITGTNMFTWVKDSRLKYDPEVDASGAIGLTAPPIKSIVYSVNVKF